MSRAAADIVVVGSGGAGLTAALAAAASGARVTVLEKSALLGGTTALSGGLLWVPDNHLMGPAGLAEPEGGALEYLLRLADGRREETVMRGFLASAPELAPFLEAHSPLRFELLDKPDYHPEFDGALTRGRCIAPLPLPASCLDGSDLEVRSGVFSLPLSWRELDASNGVFHPERLDFDLIRERTAAGLVGMGSGLITGLARGCLDRGVSIRTGVRVLALERDSHGSVVGVRVGDTTVFADAVILAAGGFEWNAALVRRFVAGPMTHPASCPTSEGDALLMATAVGAGLANMCDLWRSPTAAIPGEAYEGQPLARMVVGERSLPGSILVNRHGERFVNEAHPYADVGRAFAAWDPVAADHRNQPAWAILDATFRRQYAVLTAQPGAGDPDWLVSAGSIEQLAQRCGIDSAGLTATIGRFNEMVARNVDLDFHRGESLFDQYYADFGREPSPTLGTIADPPFYALRVHSGAIGSAGGILTDAWGAVLAADGTPITGLYAAGDSAASTTGPGYAGPGSPLGAGLTMGLRAAQAVIRTATGHSSTTQERR